MNVIARVFKPLQHAAKAFFSHDLAVQRADGGLHIVLKERPAKPEAGAVDAAAPTERRPDELALIRRQLADVLDAGPGTRSALRHLVFVEHALAKKGLRALDKLPLDVLRRALEQFEGLITNWSPVGLASLRSKMAVAVMEREQHDADTTIEDSGDESVLDELTTSEYAALEVSESDDADALAAAYAAVALPAPGESELEFQAELGSVYAKAMAAATASATSEPLPEIKLRELQA